MSYRHLFCVTLAWAFLGAAAALAQEPASSEDEPDALATDQVADAQPATQAPAEPFRRTTDPEGYAASPYPFPSQAYNYYYPAAGSGMMPARLYLCPRPVPLWVGYTYITYQGLAPHEFLYKHQQTYYRYNPGSGTTMTWITWR